MQGRSLLIIFLLSQIFASSALARNIYKWTDEDGHIHYGENPPEKGASEVRIKYRGGVETIDRPAPSGKTHADPKTQRDKMIQAMEADRLARKEKRQKKEKQQRDHQMQCAKAKDRLRQYRQASSLYKLKPDGSRQTLPDSVRQNEIERLQTDIKKWCK